MTQCQLWATAASGGKWRAGLRAAPSLTWPKPVYTHILIKYYISSSAMMEGSAYIHSTSPKPLASNIPKAIYRGEEENLISNNIMFDRRVVRGNTYAAHVVTQNAQHEVERLRHENERTLRREATRRRRGQLEKPNTPPPASGRVHVEAQTETFLEELYDLPVETVATTQTEPLLDRPPSPLFIPSKTGVDKETEIPPSDLFDFDMEVKPILEVVVGKTLRISMLEVMEELTLAACIG